MPPPPACEFCTVGPLQDVQCRVVVPHHVVARIRVADAQGSVDGLVCEIHAVADKAEVLRETGSEQPLIQGLGGRVVLVASWSVGLLVVAGQAERGMDWDPCWR